MKSVPKLIRRFVGILLLSSILIVMINVIAFVALMASKIPDENTSPYSIAQGNRNSIKSNSQWNYVLSEDISAKLAKNDIWAILIEDDSRKVYGKQKMSLPLFQTIILCLI